MVLGEYALPKGVSKMYIIYTLQSFERHPLQMPCRPPETFLLGEHSFRKMEIAVYS